jgi:hypothetical protein
VLDADLIEDLAAHLPGRLLTATSPDAATLAMGPTR